MPCPECDVIMQSPPFAFANKYISIYYIFTSVIDKAGVALPCLKSCRVAPPCKMSRKRSAASLRIESCRAATHRVEPYSACDTLDHGAMQFGWGRVMTHHVVLPRVLFVGRAAVRVVSMRLNSKCRNWWPRACSPPNSEEPVTSTWLVNCIELIKKPCK